MQRRYGRRPKRSLMSRGKLPVNASTNQIRNRELAALGLRLQVIIDIVRQEDLQAFHELILLTAGEHSLSGESGRGHLNDRYAYMPLCHQRSVMGLDSGNRTARTTDKERSSGSCRRQWHGGRSVSRGHKPLRRRWLALGRTAIRTYPLVWLRIGQLKWKPSRLWSVKSSGVPLI